MIHQHLFKQLERPHLFVVTSFTRFESRTRVEFPSNPINRVTTSGSETGALIRSGLHLAANTDLL